MGKVEKFIVLSVLLVIVGILVVSLTMDDPLKSPKSENAVQAADSQTHGAGTSATPIVPDPAAKSATAPTKDAMPQTTLSVAVTPPPPVLEPAIPPGSILKTADGLSSAYESDLKFYTWQSGDTYPNLSQRFYGDMSHVAMLKRVNEGHSDVQPGDRVLVPIYDLDAPRKSTVVDTQVAAPPPLAQPVVPTTKTAPAGGPKSHVVKEGESLWKISKAELGSGARWKEIFDANRDVLSSPEAVHTGQTLRIP
jgi:nucleoid-associated protein YgaU